MNPNPFGNRQPPHDEVIRRFLQRLNDSSSPKPRPVNVWQPAPEQLVSSKAAEELARWFRK